MIFTKSHVQVRPCGMQAGVPTGHYIGANCVVAAADGHAFVRRLAHMSPLEGLSIARHTLYAARQLEIDSRADASCGDEEHIGYCHQSPQCTRPPPNENALLLRLLHLALSARRQLHRLLACRKRRALSKRASNLIHLALCAFAHRTLFSHNLRAFSSLCSVHE